MHRYSCSYRRQSGVVLVMALIVLLTLTIFGLITLQSSQIQERIASNMRQTAAAMQTADFALRTAEKNISSTASTPPAAASDSNYTGDASAGAYNTNGLYNTGKAPDPLDANTWTTARSAEATLSSTSLPTGVSASPRYFIEKMGSMSIKGYASGNVYRIVARGTGGGNSQVIYESFYAK